MIKNSQSAKYRFIAHEYFVDDKSGGTTPIQFSPQGIAFGKTTATELLQFFANWHYQRSLIRKVLEIITAD